MIINALPAYNSDFLFPYVTISYASGQWFVTDNWQKYHALLPKADENALRENRLYRLVFDHRDTTSFSFFTQGRGETWKNWDNVMFLWLGDHYGLLISCCVAVGLVLWLARRSLSRRYLKGYAHLPGPG